MNPLDQEKNGAIIAVDLDNLLLSSFEENVSPKDYDLREGFTGMINWVKTYAKILCLHFYMPTSQETRNFVLWDSLWQEFSKEFVCEFIHCPKKAKNPRTKKTDNVDQHLIVHSKQVVAIFSENVKYFVLASGDIDYSPLLWDFKRNSGIEIAFAVGSHNSWSRAYQSMGIVGKHPVTGNDLVHYFLPRKKQ